MAKVEFEIPKELIEKAAEKEISKLRQELARLGNHAAVINKLEQKVKMLQEENKRVFKDLCDLRKEKLHEKIDQNKIELYNKLKQKILAICQEDTLIFQDISSPESAFHSNCEPY